MFIDNSYKQGLLYETAPSPRPDSFWVGAFFYYASRSTEAAFFTWAATLSNWSGVRD